MQNNIYKANVGTIHRKAVKAGLTPGLFVGLLSAVCLLFMDSVAHRYTSMQNVAIIALLAGVAFGMLRAAYVWAQILIRFRGRLSF